jgi:hypothetical protein
MQVEEGMTRLTPMYALVRIWVPVQGTTAVRYFYERVVPLLYVQ